MNWLLVVICGLLVVRVIQGGMLMATVREELDRLIAKVTDVETKGDSLITALNGLADLMRQNAADPAEIRALADRLEAQVGEFQTAIDTVPPPTP